MARVVEEKRRKEGGTKADVAGDNTNGTMRATLKMRWYRIAIVKVVKL
jgi:hypothetical protein